MRQAQAVPQLDSALVKSLALHLLVLVLLVLLPFIHLPEKHEPQYIQAVIMAPHHTAPKAKPAPPAPPPPTVAAVTPPEPVMPPAPAPPPAPVQHKTPLPTADNKKAVAKAAPKPLPTPAPPKVQPKPVPVPVAKPVTPPPPKPAPKPPKPAISQQSIDNEIADIDQQVAQAKQLQHQQQIQQMQQEAAASAQALSQKADKQIIQEYKLKIQQQIRRNWIKPLSAKSGMVSKIRLTLQPSGDVINVITIQSSGDAAFDFSAEQAARKASPLPVPDDLEIFNSTFRSLTLLFAPEDL